MPRLSKIGAAALAAFGWTSGSSVTATYLQVAGGGGGGTGQASSTIGGGGGGGAGGYLTGTTTLNLSSSYTVIVGAGGRGGIPNGGYSTNGGNSQFGSLTASVGGGLGGNYDGSGSGSSQNAGVGGSGGGGDYGVSTGAAGTAGQGNAGGNAYTPGAYYGNGGGGGAGAAGSSASSNTVAPGGVGLANSISGTSIYYAGGGGGGSGQTAGGSAAGGNGGGGAGGYGTVNATAGTANLGGGGGGGGNQGVGGTASSYGGNGGSGVVIISYPAPQKFGGGIVTTSGGNVIHTFTTSGTLSPLSTLSADYLIVAGGGGGGCDNAGGGGAGGMQTGSGLTIDTNSTYLVTVGSGGPGSTTGSATGTNGGNSVFGIVATASVGGGGGGSDTSGARTGANGGSGGGGAGNNNSPGGSGTSGQGNAGGTGYFVSQNPSLGGGGGGAGAVGNNGNTGGNNAGGNGGNGLQSSISGTATYYAGGGGGGNQNGASTVATGGLGGGGNGGCTPTSTAPTNATANTGGGGGGGLNAGRAGSNGGSGIVIIRYAGSTQLMAGGTVTITGGYVIHTFTSSGYLAPLKFVGNSLRYRASAGGYLSRTPSVAGNQQKWTFSAWIKMSLDNQANNPRLISAGTTTGKNGFTFVFTSDTYQLGLLNDLVTPNTVYMSSNVFRDPAAWYHIVVAVDTTQATAANRLLVYVNGVQVNMQNNYAGWGSYTPITQNYNTPVNGTGQFTIGCRGAPYTDSFFDGNWAEINHIDGQQLTPNAFGTFNSYGVWQPITYGGSYGTNGFYLPFSAGTVNYAGSFSGSSSNLQIANSAVFNAPGTQNFTVEGWYYLNSIPGSGIYGFWGTDNGSGATAKQTAYIDTSGLVHFDVTLSGGASTATTATALSTGRWYHLAWVRNGSTFTIYVNGVAQATGTSSVNLTGLTQPFYVGYVGEPSGTFAGYVSNFRYVLGTAIYTSNFIPPTSALTNVSGTVLLTLQNSTIIDNSSNAFSITNNGSITMAPNYPFSAAQIFYDQGPAGNNWTPNNISGANGSTMDYMTDVPTLTSATAANTCVINPLFQGASNYQLTNGNLKVYRTGATQSYVLGTFAVNSGKFYWEVTASSIASNYPRIGISCAYSNGSNEPYTNYLCGNADGTGRSWGASNGSILPGVPGSLTGALFNGSNTASAFAFYSTGDVVMFALDMDNKKLWFGKNGTWYTNSTTTTTAANIANNTATPAFSDLSGQTWTPAIFANQNADIWAPNFGQQPFVYTPPSGFVALNTYNL